MAQFEFPKFLYARTKDNKTIDVSYAPQTPDAVEYIRNYIVQQEQLEVDFEKDAVQFCFDKGLNVTPYQAKTIARHYYELGNMGKIVKIRAEIERLKDEYTDIAIDSHYGTVNANSIVDDLEQLLSLINSHQQEQPEADLEEEMDRFFEEMPIQEHENIFEDTYQMIARHFYELGKNSK